VGDVTPAAMQRKTGLGRARKVAARSWTTLAIEGEAPTISA